MIQEREEALHFACCRTELRAQLPQITLSFGRQHLESLSSAHQTQSIPICELTNWRIRSNQVVYTLVRHSLIQQFFVRLDVFVSSAAVPNNKYHSSKHVSCAT